MKKVLLFFAVSLSLSIQAQSYTEKWNDLYNRYEYFNNQGRMIGYKYYDDLYRVWKYKDLSDSPNSSYIDPINTKLVNRALASKDTRYSVNVQKIQNAITTIFESNKSTSDHGLRTAIDNRYQNEIVKVINSKNYDYSSSSITNQVLNYIYKTANRINEEEVKRFMQD